MRSLAPRVLVASAACIIALALACGGVPTLADGIAFITPIMLPSPAVAAGDTLRDSLGKVAPLKVLAYDQNDNVIPNVATSFLVSTLPPQVQIDANGIVTAFDTVGTVQLVGRIGERLQTAATNLLVVAQPDSIAATGSLDSLVVNTPSSALQVTVTGLRKGTRTPVSGIVVRYRVASTVPSRTIDPTLFFFTTGLRSDLTMAVDTTKTGVASKLLIASDTQGLTSIVVEASANNLRGVPLHGSPVRFVIPVKKGG